MLPAPIGLEIDTRAMPETEEDSSMTLSLPGALVSAAWLAQHVNLPRLRLYDCTVSLGYEPSRGVKIRGARLAYEAAHIPGAAFLDLARDFSVTIEGVGLMRPPPEAFGHALGAAGVGEDSLVVLYSTGSVMWAARMWWLLRANGFTQAAVLDGGLRHWIAEGRPTRAGEETYPPARFVARPDPACWVDRDEVLAAIDNRRVCTIHTLSRREYLGLEEQSPFEKAAYGRPGRIQGSRNVPYAELLTAAGLFRPVAELRRIFADAGALTHERIIGYCGAGISSTMAALALHLIGQDNVAIYDGSLHEWGRDGSLPMETG